MNTLALNIALFMLAMGAAVVLIFLGIALALVVGIVRGAFMPVENEKGFEP